MVPIASYPSEPLAAPLAALFARRPESDPEVEDAVREFALVSRARLGSGGRVHHGLRGPSAPRAGGTRSATSDASALFNDIDSALEEYGAIVVVPSLEVGIELLNRLAPEHAELQVTDPWRWVELHSPLRRAVPRRGYQRAGWRLLRWH